MASRVEWAGIGPFLLLVVPAIALAAWQVRVDRSVFDRFLGGLDPVGVMVATAVAGVVAIAFLQGASDFAVLVPGRSGRAASIVAVSVPLLAALAIGADVLLGFPEDMNVAVPDALRFYPAIAVFVEVALHVVPITVLVAVLGAPTGLDASFWRIAVPVAAIEAALQAAYATSAGTSVFSAVHLAVFGVVQVWVFWRFGFAWMLGFRLAYYGVWHIAWGILRLHVLF